MKKFGWSEGTGLGKKNQGISVPIEVIQSNFHDLSKIIKYKNRQALDNVDLVKEQVVLYLIQTIIT